MFRKFSSIATTRQSQILFAGICAVIALGVLNSLLVPSMLLAVFLILLVSPVLRADRRSISAMNVLITSSIYAGTLALLIVYLRVAQGFIIPKEPLLPQVSVLPLAYFAIDQTLSVYNKSHVRTALVQFLLFSSFFFIALLPILSRCRVINLRVLVNPFTALTIFIVVAKLTPVPPFAIDGPHWAHWVGPGLALLDGQWPYLDTFSYYGLMPIVLLTAWVWLFGLSPLALVFFLTVLAFAASILMFKVTLRLSRSPMLAFVAVALLILLAYDHKVMAIPTPNHSALRFHFLVATVLWVSAAFIGAIPRKNYTVIGYAFLLGLLTTWSPLEGFFLLVAVTTIVGLALATNPAVSLRRVAIIYAAYWGGIIVIPFFAVVMRGSLTGFVSGLARITDFFSIFPEGYGYLPQYFDGSIFFLIIMVCGLMLYCVRAIIRGQYQNPLFLFCVLSLIFGAPAILQALGRSPIIPNGVIWPFLPAFFALLARAMRLGKGKKLGTFTTAAILLLLVLAHPVVDLIKQLRALTVGREQAIHAWAMECAVKKSQGQSCDSVDPVTLHGLFQAENIFTFQRDVRYNRMVFECQDGALIIDPLDSFVYHDGHCRPRHPYQSFFSISTKKQVEEYVELLTVSDGAVYFGKSDWEYQNRLLNQIKQVWYVRRRAASVCDTEKSGKISFGISRISDAAWSRGVGLTNKARVIVDTDRDILCYLSPGMRLHFAGSGERKITHILGEIIELDGPPLDSMADGYPNQVKIVKE